MSISRKTSTVRPHEVRRHTLSKIRKAISMNTTIKDRKASKTVAKCKKLKTTSMTRETDETEGLSFYSVQKICIS